MTTSYTVNRRDGSTLGSFRATSPMDAARKGISIDRDLRLVAMPKIVAFYGCTPILYAANDNPDALYSVEPFSAEVQL